MSTVTASVSWRVWWQAARPKTLVAAFAPVFLGSALAWYKGAFDPLVFTLTLVAAVAIQIATNFFNEVYDYWKGADTGERLGPPRLVAQGVIAPQAMMRAALSLSALALLAGIPLILRGGLPIVLIGGVSLLLAWAYTGGPFPLAYRGLGEVFVFVFFGIVAVGGTFYLHTLSYSLDALLLSFIPGALSTALLLVNNLRDIPTDRASQKRTLSVRLGRRKSEKLYQLLLFLPFPTTLLLIGLGLPWTLLLDFFTLPTTVRLARLVRQLQGRALNQLLEKTAILLWVHTILLVAGLIVGKQF